jgi:CBS domain-containing protein
VKVEEVMTSDVAGVSPGTPLKGVAATLVERRILGLPVVDGDRPRTVGVVVHEIEQTSF